MGRRVPWVSGVGTSEFILTDFVHCTPSNVVLPTHTEKMFSPPRRRYGTDSRYSLRLKALVRSRKARCKESPVDPSRFS